MKRRNVIFLVVIKLANQNFKVCYTKICEFNDPYLVGANEKRKEKSNNYFT